MSSARYKRSPLVGILLILAVYHSVACACVCPGDPYDWAREAKGVLLVKINSQERFRGREPECVI